MSLDFFFRCRVTMRALPAFGSYIRDGRRVCDCHGEPVWVDLREISHVSHTSEGQDER